MDETMRALEMYRAFAEGPLAMPVVAGEKPENERFPGAVATYSIEAMMQDGKALQAGTSHYLGTGFAEAAGIRYQDREGTQALCHTTSWGVSTRLIGGLIMTHGDDDGLRVPPQVAPFQVVILPMLRDNDEDAAVLDYCRPLADVMRSMTVFGESLRVMVDSKATKGSTKRWGWIKKGAPIIAQIGPRDVANRNVSVFERNRLYTTEGKLRAEIMSRGDFIQRIGELLTEMQTDLYAEARARRDAAIRPMREWSEVEAYFAGDEVAVKGWAQVGWSKPTGDALEAVETRLKALKLTIRNTPLDLTAPDGPCLFTGAPAVETIYLARSY
jgi:prolyl-tRNA synthetase